MGAPGLLRDLGTTIAGFAEPGCPIQALLGWDGLVCALRKDPPLRAA